MKKFALLLTTLCSIFSNVMSITCTDITHTLIQNDLYENVPRINFTDGSIASIPNVNVYMDIYKPNINNPTEAVIIIHGQGENKQYTRYTRLSESFAKRGIIAASIDNRIDILDLPGILNSLHFSTNSNSIHVNNRIYYSNAMDIHNAIKRIKYLYPSVTKFFICGASRGGASALYASYVDKNEISSSFPTNFISDNLNYLDMSIQKPYIKGCMVFFGGIFNTNWIGTNENIPLFLYHGTKDPSVPIYYSTCPLPVYGSARITQRLDSLDKSFYFIEAGGLGHVTSICTFEDLWTATGFEKLWFADLFNFIYKSMISNNKVQVYKKITPINNAYNYCSQESLKPGCGGAGSNSCFISLPNTFSLIHITPLSNSNTCSLPIVYTNTSSTENCVINNINYGRLAKDNKKNENVILQTNTHIYPNPTTGILKINLNLNYYINNYIITVYSIDGRIVYNESKNEVISDSQKLEIDLDLSSQNNGLYLISISSGDNILLHEKVLINK